MAPQERVEDTPEDAARVRAVARGRSPLRRLRREKLLRRHILARGEKAREQPRQEVAETGETGESTMVLPAAEPGAGRGPAGRKEEG